MRLLKNGLIKLSPKVREMCISLWDTVYERPDSIGTVLGNSYPDVRKIIQKLKDNTPLTVKEFNAFISWRCRAGTIHIGNDFYYWKRMINQATSLGVFK